MYPRKRLPNLPLPWPAMVRERAGLDDAEEADDELFLLGERIAELAARINSAESRMMKLIADFDRRGGWKDEFSSCAELLAWRIGIKIGPARERVRTARALAGLRTLCPRVATASRNGRRRFGIPVVEQPRSVRAPDRTRSPAPRGCT